ncbi:hypothetical protein [Bauldia litoralis]|uniref:hypothetical protein n=1 Tax=Bauldia litoralis TaxID=665467 RepID=UPI001113957F|nr:hypothetical protein [Bauldia litoralis]
MTNWKQIENGPLLAAIERYRKANGTDPRDDQPGLDGDEGLLGVYLIASGFPPDGYEVGYAGREEE